MSAESAIRLLRRVVLSRDCEKMSRSTIKGFLGELLVKKRLEDEGIVVRHFGNQFGFDLQFPIGTLLIRADVKMSLPKDEFKWGFDYWGWALVHENKKKKVAATHFICVGCSPALEIERLFVVPASRAEEFPRGIRQFSEVKHALILPCDPARTIKLRGSDARFIAACERLRGSGAVNEVTAGQSLVASLRRTLPHSRPRCSQNTVLSGNLRARPKSRSNSTLRPGLP